MGLRMPEEDRHLREEGGEGIVRVGGGAERAVEEEEEEEKAGEEIKRGIRKEVVVVQVEEEIKEVVETPRVMQ